MFRVLGIGVLFEVGVAGLGLLHRILGLWQNMTTGYMELFSY